MQPKLLSVQTVLSRFGLNPAHPKACKRMGGVKVGAVREPPLQGVLLVLRSEALLRRVGLEL